MSNKKSTPNQPAAETPSTKGSTIDAILSTPSDESVSPDEQPHDDTPEPEPMPMSVGTQSAPAPTRSVFGGPPQIAVMSSRRPGLKGRIIESEETDTPILLLKDLDPPPVIGRYVWRQEQGDFKRGGHRIVPKFVARKLQNIGAATLLTLDTSQLNLDPVGRR